ncbi:MAG: LysR family transcriptional regulator [Rhizobiales bacterium 32-66-8]|nr:MAG: LysR family transcriptional regulator [Rhizobiales bacterium 32-66-8]
MNNVDLHVFATVAESGGIGRAASQLNTVQSNVTARMRALEGELGVPLFHRHSRGVMLTAAGERLLPYAKRIGQLLLEARQAVAEGPVPSGALRLGSLETTAAMRLPPILMAYTRAYPKVDLQIDTGPTDGLLDKVLQRDLEGAFVTGPVTHADLVAVPVVQEELVLVTAPDRGPDGGLRSRGPNALALAGSGPEPKILVFRSGCSYRQRLEAMLATEGGGAPLRRLEFGTLDGILGCVSAGLGITLLPRAVAAPAAAAGQVALHPLPDRSGFTWTVFVRRRDGFLSSALARFIECAVATTASAQAAA